MDIATLHYDLLHDLSSDDELVETGSVMDSSDLWKDVENALL
jgi:hypothetical protein